MTHYLIFSGVNLAIILAGCIFYYRKKMIGMRSLLISLISFVVLDALAYFFIYR